MRRLTGLCLLLLTCCCFFIAAHGAHGKDEIEATRIQRDIDGVTTVLLVPARPGKSAPPVGVLTKTARTFVQDGASTEFATQVVGTTLDNGRLYAKILSTSSRVFYDREPTPDESAPYLVYPSKTPQDAWSDAKLTLDDAPIKIVKTISDINGEIFQDSKDESSELKYNDILNKPDSSEERFKPAKVRNDNLPTYTVNQGYVDKGLDAAASLEEEQPKTFRPRVPKIFRPQPKITPKKDTKPLATVTYHGFADFVTTVGDTVIVFSPSTAPAPVGRPATTIKGDATLRPDDGIAVLKIKPTSVVPQQKKTETISLKARVPVNDVVQKSSKQPNSAIDLQPSSVGHPEGAYSGEVTKPLLLVPDELLGSDNPTGLIKVIDSTTTVKGTTTHYMSSIIGTYIGTNYAQIVHTSSNVYFFPEDSTKSLNDDDVSLESISTLPPESTDNVLTTIKDILTTEPTTESELGNDIIPPNQGRSLKGTAPRNQFLAAKGDKAQKEAEEKASFATKLIPSTVYKTFTYFTTFFIPGKDKTSTSVKSREVVSSELTFVPEVVPTTSSQSVRVTPTKARISPTNKVEISSNTDLIENTNVDKQEVEEIQLIFKTIFTTFTYLTTFYDDSTTSVSSRKVTATNVITQTIEPVASSVDFDGLIDKDASIAIAPTKVTEPSFATKAVETQTNNYDNNFTVPEESTENILTTVQDDLTTLEEEEVATLESTTESMADRVEPVVQLEPSPSVTETAQLATQVKTYYTTYTYFTTIIVDDETEIETRTEVFSNVITESIQPTSVVPAVERTSVTTPKPAPPPEILAYLEALKKQKSEEEARLLAKKAQEKAQVMTTEEPEQATTEDSSLFSYTDETTIMDEASTEKMSNDGEVLGSMKTDVIFTSSSGGSTVLDVADKKNSVPEDQELSETNHHDVEPAPTLLLQTSYTTYTYFTTMYNGDATDVVSRLKTVTNVVTETIKPTAVMQPETKTQQPLTYFTTFTYWTTFIKGDETATTSREETVSNVVTPGVTETPSVQLEVVKTYRPFVLATPVHSIAASESRESKATSDNEVTTSPNVILQEVPTVKVNELSSTISPEPMTLYTTFTYFTTSYIGNSTILKSRLETVTSVSYPDDLVVKATPRAIGGPAPTAQILATEEKPIEPSKTSDAPKTGLLSTIRTSQVNDGTTTHFMTDVYGTYIDGLYAQVVETSTKLELPTPVYSPSATPVLPTGVLSLNKGRIVDADEITTIFYTTKQIGSTINGLYVKVLESTSTTTVDEKKLATHTPVHGHRTGFVRLIKGEIEANDTTTYYQSKVIGTSIDGRYAQIIESTSSYLIAKATSTLDIAATSTLPPNHATGVPEISPSPAVIQSSISEDHTGDLNDSDQEENENEEEEGDDQKSTKKSRLTFSSRKRTSSAPPIRPFASRSRPTFNPKRKPQGATTITRSDITPTITATLAGKGSRFASSRGRATPSLGSSSINASSSRRFSGGRRSSVPASSAFSTNYPSASSRSRGAARASPSSAYSGSRRGSSSIRSSSLRPSGRSSPISLSSTRYRPGIRPSSTLAKLSSTLKHEDQEDNANEFTSATLATEESPVLEEGEDETIPPTPPTTTESARRASNPLLRFRRPPAFGSGIRSTPKPAPATTTTRRANNPTRQNTSNRPVNARTRPTPPALSSRTRQGDFLEEPSGTSSIVENYHSFGQRTHQGTQGPDYYVAGDEEEEEDDYVPKKRVRVRVPVVRSRSAKEHALTVVRRRPLVPYTRSSLYESIEATPTRRRVVTRTRLRNVDSADYGNSLADDYTEDFQKANRHKVTVTRRRKVRPTAASTQTQRERITRKKLVNVRPVPAPTSTLAIITTGFYTVATDDDDGDDYYDSEDSKVPTPELYPSTQLENAPNEAFTVEPEQPSSSSDPIIITDNFFFPGFSEETTTTESGGDDDSNEETDTEKNEFLDSTTLSAADSTSENGTSTTEETDTEKEIDATTESASDNPETIGSTVVYPTIVEDEKATTESSSGDRAEEDDPIVPKSQSEDSEIPVTETTLENVTPDDADDLRVIPIATSSTSENTFTRSDDSLESSPNIDSSEIPTVIPLESKSIEVKSTSASDSQVTTSLPSLTPEDIEAGLTDDLYLSLSRPDFPQIDPSKVEADENAASTSSQSSQATPELQTSIYYSETVVTSTRLRTYTYVVTTLNGQETEVTSSTTVRPRVTTLTLTVPVTVTVTPTMVSSSIALSSALDDAQSNEEVEDEGRRFNLATRVMSNGVEVIVAGTTPAYRWENSNPQPTLTLSEAVVMLLPQDKPNEFVTKTCTTTFTYLNTITRDGTTIVSTDEQVIANTATEERHRKPVSEAASVTLEASPTLQTEVFKTTYTYLTLNTDHPDEKNALGSSTRVITNTVTAPQYYLDMVLEPSETQQPETNTYMSTRALEKTYIEDGKTRVEMTHDIVTQLIVTESAPPPKPVSVTTTLTALDDVSTTDVAKTYYITYTYLNTYLEKDSTVVKTNIATSSDIVYEKVPVKKTVTKSVPVTATPEPIQIFATKTYLTTYTYFTTLLQAGVDGETSTTVSSRTQIVENVVTESIAPSLLEPGYMNALLTTSHHSDTLKNVITGSTIIFFDDEEEVTPSTTSAYDQSATASVDKIDDLETASSSSIADSVGSETNEATSNPIEPDNSHNEEEIPEESTNPPPSKKPSQVSNLLSLGSLGINSLSALGPVITAMAGLLQGKTSATRRNDTEPITEPPATTTQRSPIYIPVAEFVDGDIETAESQNIALHLANSNHLPETRHKVTASLADGIPISPGEVITANSDVIIGKPGKMGPRPPQTFGGQDENIGMKPPPVSVPNIPVHPVFEVLDNEPKPKPPIKIQKGSQQLEIYPAHQIYEEHIKGPVVFHEPAISQRPQQQIYSNNNNNNNQAATRISSKQDILENDPLLIPPSRPSSATVDSKHRNSDKNKRPPWSPQDPLVTSNVLIDDKHRLHSKEFVKADNLASYDGSRIKAHVPEPIVHQVPHVIDRSTGQPLLVNIQPSQVANVVIPQGGTQALIFGDTSEPHISGQYFDDPSPYPEPEVGPGFIGIDKIENLPQYSKNDDPADYMRPPALPANQIQNLANRHHSIPISQGSEKVPTRYHDKLNLSTGQGHVHSEILVHHGAESGHVRAQSRPATSPPRNYPNVQFPPRREHTKIHLGNEQIPPRRTEVPLPAENSFYDSSNAGSLLHTSWKNEKKPLLNPQTRWPRPTSRPRPPTRITARPFGRPPTRIERPKIPIRQPPVRLPQNTYYQQQQQQQQQQPSVAPFTESNQQIYNPAHQEQANKVHQYQEENYKIPRQEPINNQSLQENVDYITDDHAADFGYKNPSSNDPDKAIVDSEVDASENVKVTSDNEESHHGHADSDSSSKYESGVRKEANNYHGDNGPAPTSADKHVYNNNHEEGDIIIGSEKKQDQYLTQAHNSYDSGVVDSGVVDSGVVDSGADRKQPGYSHEIIDLKPPAIIAVFEPNGHSRPFSKPNFAVSNSDSGKSEVITESPDVNHVSQVNARPVLGQVFPIQSHTKERESQRNKTYAYNRGRPQYDHHATRSHPEHPQIITKPKAQLPGPVDVSSGKLQKPSSGHHNRKPTVQFSLPIDSTGEENESKTQTERAPSASTGSTGPRKPTEESLATAFQTNFASTDSKEDDIEDDDSKSGNISQDMVPPPVAGNKQAQMEEGLRPPPSPTDVLGLSPPPVDITSIRPTTTSMTSSTTSLDNKSKIKSDVSGLKPPPLYIPLKESSPRPSVVRPYLADILSQDMVPPPPAVKTTRPLEIATVRPGVAVSGSIQIGTAVATSHIPVMQDIESKIPIVHGTVDLPVVVNVPEEFLKPIDTKKPDRVSVYTARPFETKHRHVVKPTIASISPSSSTAVRHSQYYNNHQRLSPTRIAPSTISRKPSKVPDLSIVLEPSVDVQLPSQRIEPTETLTVNYNGNKRTKQRTEIDGVTMVAKAENSEIAKTSVATKQETRKTDPKIKESASKMMEIIGTVVHEFIQNSTNERVQVKPQEVTRFETLTVTRTETSVVGSPPTTRTLLITHTLTSVRIETVTKTLLRPTSVISTITSTILQSVTRSPGYENGNDNESIFVVMSDQKPPAVGAEEVEAEYGEEEISRDEQDVSGNEIHRVLSGGILGAPSVPVRPPNVQCVPDCKASKSEVCAESNGEMRCVCRRGFARMFPDRPCKPTYTFTLGVGLERLGRDRIVFDSSMNDSSSMVFRRYAHPIKEALDRTLMQSDLRDVYRALNIARFTRDPPKVVFNVQLTANSDETRLKEVIRKYLVMSNYSLGGTEVYASKDLGMVEAIDFDECGVEEGGPHHDCSPNAACFNLKGSYQCSCKEGYADLSENPAYPGRVCSQAPLGCAACNNKGHCAVNVHGQEVCECFAWHSGQKCQINLKVLLIALVTTGAILVALLAVCLGMACFRNPSRRSRSAACDRRAMISGPGAGDTSSEGSLAELAIPHHVPHILPPPPQMVAPAPPSAKRPARKISSNNNKARRAPRKPVPAAPIIAPVVASNNNSCPPNDQRDRSLTVMIPRAKYRSAPQSSTPQNYKPMSSFAVEEHKLIDYLEAGCDYKSEQDSRMAKQQQQQQHQPTGALVSAGFQVSATVTRTLEASAESTIEPSSKSEQELETTIQASTKQLMRLDLADAGSTLARSCGETTIQAPTKMAEHRNKDCNRDARDSASEGHTMAERDLGSTLRLPAQHAPLYHQDRASSDRESNFDSF